MTVIHGIEIDHPRWIRNEMKEAIHHNDPLEDQLHVVMVVSNPCQYARRYILAKEFIQRMELEPHVLLYIVELCYEDQSFCLTHDHPRHLQLRTSTPLWHKENMINLGVKSLLPKAWKAFAWVDADLEFDSASWALDTLKILNGCCDIVQLFSHCTDLDADENPMQIFQSFGFQYCKKKPYSTTGLHFWHPGFAWAMTRKAYDRVGGLYEQSILGSGDHNMAMSLIGQGSRSLNANTTEAYKKSVEDYQRTQQTLRLGYVPGLIRHYFHGSKQNRKYTERWQILVKHQYDPTLHITHKQGLIVPTKACPPQLLEDILQYFRERNEDEGFF